MFVRSNMVHILVPNVKKETSPCQKRHKTNEKRKKLMPREHDYRHNSIYSDDSVNAKAHLQGTNAFEPTKVGKGFFFSVHSFVRSFSIFLFISLFSTDTPSFVIINGISMLMLCYFLNDIQATHAWKFFSVLQIHSFALK